MNRNFWKRIGIIAAATLITVVAIRFAQAGTLTPNSLPASTMHSVQEIYDSLFGTFDSGSLAASSTGNVMQIARCAAVKVSGGNCQ